MSHALKPYSHSGPGGAPQEGTFDVAFIGQMLKHGFTSLGTSGAPTDTMHFELRWYGPIGPGGHPPVKSKRP